MALDSQLKIDALGIRVYDSAEAMGVAAADFVTGHLKQVIERKGTANLLLATGTSQFSFLTAFTKENDLDWSKISVFHLDEYIGIPADHPASFRKYLLERVIDKVHPGKVYLLRGDERDLVLEMDRYEALLNNHPIDIACIGIGENGHIAFNEPVNTDFQDPRLVRTVELDQASRKQQVNEGWFNSIDGVPHQALTLTVTAIMRSSRISCVVPDHRKAKAVEDTLYGAISPQCPASILRTHRDAVLFLDTLSASRLKT